MHAQDLAGVVKDDADLDLVVVDDRDLVGARGVRRGGIEDARQIEHRDHLPAQREHAFEIARRQRHRHQLVREMDHLANAVGGIANSSPPKSKEPNNSGVGDTARRTITRGGCTVRVGTAAARVLGQFRYFHMIPRPAFHLDDGARVSDNRRGRCAALAADVEKRTCRPLFLQTAFGRGVLVAHAAVRAAPPSMLAPPATITSISA